MAAATRRTIRARGIPVLRMRMRVVGARSTMLGLQRAQKDMIHAVGYALYQEGKALWSAARGSCPVWTGTLRESHYLTMPEERPGSVQVEVGAGGWAQDYALRQHEDVTLSHKHGEAKWLEKRLNELMGGFERRFAAKVGRAFSKGLRAVRDPKIITDPFDGPDLRPEKLRTGPDVQLKRSWIKD